MTGRIDVWAVYGIGEVRPGDDLAALILEAADRQGTPVADGDVLVVTQKIVSKAEGRLVVLDDIQPSGLAHQWASAWDKDPRVVEIVVREARRVVRFDRGVLICETRHGFVCANAGVDCSNVARGVAALLPLDPDASAEHVRQQIHLRRGATVGIVISDTCGRAWRGGQTDIAIGIAGLRPIQADRTRVAVADELASTAELVIGKLNRAPVAMIRGMAEVLGEGQRIRARASSRARSLPLIQLNAVRRWRNARKTSRKLGDRVNGYGSTRTGAAASVHSRNELAKGELRISMLVSADTGQLPAGRS